MSTERRAADIKANLKADLNNLFEGEGWTTGGMYPNLELITGDVMFQVEKLLAEIEDLNNELSIARSVAEVAEVAISRADALKAARAAVLKLGSPGGAFTPRSETVNMNELLAVADWLVTGILPAMQFEGWPGEVDLTGLVPGTDGG